MTPELLTPSSLLFRLLQCAPDPLRREWQLFDPRSRAPPDGIRHRRRYPNDSPLAQSFGTIRARSVGVFDQNRFKFIGYVIKGGHFIIDQIRIDDLPLHQIDTIHRTYARTPSSPSLHLALRTEADVVPYPHPPR